MKNEKIIEKLENIIITKNEEKNLKIMNLIEQLKKDSLIEEYKGLSSKQRVNYCLKLADKISKKRPILGCCKYDNDYQIFTDSFILVELKDADVLPLKDENDLKEYQYPNVELIEKNFINPNYKKIKIKNVKKFLQYLKTYKYLEVIKDDINIIISYEVLNNLLNFLNADINNKITFKLVNNKILVLEKNNGSRGLMLLVHESIKKEIEIKKCYINADGENYE